MRLDCFQDVVSRHLKMRRVPNRFTVAQHDHLWRFVSDASDVGKLARDISGRLHFKDVHVIEFFHFTVSTGTDGTGVTVLKNDYRFVR